jgi:hypothetical protein
MLTGDTPPYQVSNKEGAHLQPLTFRTVPRTTMLHLSMCRFE